MPHVIVKLRPGESEELRAGELWMVHLFFALNKKSKTILAPSCY